MASPPVKLSSAETKNVYLQHISSDIKEIQDAQCSVSTHEDVLTGSNKHAQLLCDHLDHILMHGLYKSLDGYWPCVLYYTHRMTVKEINELVHVTTSIGKSRSWLNMALNEQALESYLRMFIDNQKHIRLFYTKEAFLRDKERLSVLLTLIAGLDFVSFNLPTDDDFLDMSASSSVSNSGVDFSIKTNFIAAVTPELARKKKLTASDDTTLVSTTPPQSPSKSSLFSLTSSLPAIIPTNLLKQKEDKVEGKVEENKENDSIVSSVVAEEKRIEPVSIPAEDQTVEHKPSPPNVVSTEQTDGGGAALVSSEQKTEEPPAKPTSFMERFNQEKETMSEQVLVAKKKKSSKGKKKKKKKDGDVSERKKKVSARDDSVLERSDSPQSAVMESVKENQPPVLALHEDGNESLSRQSSESVKTEQLDYSTSSVKMYKENTFIHEPTSMTDDDVDTPTDDIPSLATNTVSGVTESRHHAYDELLQTSTELQSSIEDYMSTEPQTNTESHTSTEPQTSVNPFGDGNEDGDKEEIQVDETRRTSFEYQFGNVSHSNDLTIEGDSSDFSLLTDTASFARRKRPSPQPFEENIDEEEERNVKKTEELNDKETGLLAAEKEQKEQTDTGNKMTLDLADVPDTSFNSPPVRPQVITDSEKRSCDVAIDDNMRIVLSLDVFYHSNETAVRLVQAYVPQGPGRYQRVCVVVTDGAVYITQYDGTEGVFSHMMGVSYSMLNHILIGLSWQSFTIVYEEKASGIVKRQKQVVITGSEAVSRSIVDTIKKTAGTSKTHKKTIPLRHDDDARTDAIEKELIKLGSETSMEIVRYCMVYWEQLSGEPPLLSPPADISIPIAGMLHVKEISLLNFKSWGIGFFQLIDGVLYHFGSESDKSPRSSYPLRGLKCGGCTRATNETKEFAFQVLDANGSSLVLAAEDEEDMTKWMQALCLATIGEEEAIIKSPIQKGGAYCAVLLTQNKIHVLREDWSNGTVQMVASISVQDVNEICVEQKLPVYCTLSYDDWENGSQGTWMLCFSSEYELGQFEKSLLRKYKEIFQVDLGFTMLRDQTTLSRAHQAIELMQASRTRSDSITRGRTVFSFDQQ